MSKNWDLRIIGLFIFLLNIIIVFEPLNKTIFRNLLGLPFILFIPGYSLIAALFPRKNDLDNLERMALSFGLSIAVVPLIGLGLNYTPFGIRVIPVLFSISIFILAMCFITYYKRRRLSEIELFFVSFSNMVSRIKAALKPESMLDKILSIILVISIISSALALIYVVFNPNQEEKFTEFYILGNEGKAENYPVNLEFGKNSSLKVGVANHEFIPINYYLQVLLQNRTLYSKYIWLEHNSTWEEWIFFIPELKGNFIKLEFLLYKENNLTETYRDLHLWVNVT